MVCDNSNATDSTTNTTGGGNSDGLQPQPHPQAKLAERRGRWTKVEHEAFLAAMLKYGKDWKQVAAKVKTRTVVQTRTHAQKYFCKLQKSIEAMKKSGRVAAILNSPSASGATMGLSVSIATAPITLAITEQTTDSDQLSSMLDAVVATTNPPDGSIEPQLRDSSTTDDDIATSSTNSHPDATKGKRQEGRYHANEKSLMPLWR